MFWKKGQRILLVSAHMDDFEFGCGGLVARIGHEVEFYVLCLTKNRKSYHGEIQEVRDVNEQYRTMEVLGLRRENLFINEEIAGQMFPEYRQLVLETLYDTGKKCNPDAIIVPSLNDVHQDHRVTALSALKAFKRKTVISYQIFNSSMGFRPNMYVALDEEHVVKKAKALSMYRSQMDENVTTADYFSEDIVRSMAMAHGIRIGAKYAEAFEAHMTNIYL